MQMMNKNDEIAEEKSSKITKSEFRGNRKIKKITKLLKRLIWREIRLFDLEENQRILGLDLGKNIHKSVCFRVNNVSSLLEAN